MRLRNHLTPAWWVTCWVVVMVGCSSGGVRDRDEDRRPVALDVVFPDVGGDEPDGAAPADEVPDLPDADDLGTDAYSDPLPDPFGKDEVPPDDDGSLSDPGDVGSSSPDDNALVSDPGADWPDAVLCAPSDPSCPCTSDADCDQTHSGFCGQNRCNKALSVCMIAPTQKDGTPCDDQDPCTEEDACSKGICTGRPNRCDDHNPCTWDRCEPGAGCLHEPVAAPCEDGDFCRGPDSCVAGQCIPGPPLSCDDKNPCTEDSCVPSSGCQHSPRVGECDDRNACTIGDRCEAGACTPVGPLPCDDQEVCTSDSCDPESGCRHEPIEGGCDDGNPCTQGDFCAGGRCQSGPIQQCFTCGDKTCNSPTETCKTCPQDCGECPPDCVPGATIGCGATLQGTTAGGTNAITSYFSFSCLSLGTLQGPERVIPFVTNQKVHAGVTVSGGGLSGLQVFVLTENCKPSSCVAQGIGLLGMPAEALFDPDPGRTYFLTVDGSGTSGASFTLKTQCFEAACGDGQDNDQDGAMDCDDPDCGGVAIACGQTLEATIGKFSHAGPYGPSCGNQSGSRDDAVFRLAVSSAGTVRVTVTPDEPGDDLDLFILGGGCTGASCVAFGASASSSESVTFAAQPGTYYLVVEEAYTTSESTGDFQIQVLCP